MLAVPDGSNSFTMDSATLQKFSKQFRFLCTQCQKKGSRIFEDNSVFNSQANHLPKAGTNVDWPCPILVVIWFVRTT